MTPSAIRWRCLPSTASTNPGMVMTGESHEPRFQIVGELRRRHEPHDLWFDGSATTRILTANQTLYSPHHARV